MNLKCFIISKIRKIWADFTILCSISSYPPKDVSDELQEKVKQEQTKNKMLKICIPFIKDLGFIKNETIVSIKKITFMISEIKSKENKRFTVFFKSN